MKENKGEQPEQERAKDILLKYLGYGHEEIEVSFHPTDIRLMVEAMKDYAGECVMTYHAETMEPAAQPSKVQEDLKKENALLEAREVAWQNKHSFLMEEIKRLKGLIDIAYSTGKYAGHHLAGSEEERYHEQFKTKNRL